MTLQVSLAVPEGEIWSGPAGLVIAKTLDGDIGVQTGHSPVLGIMVEGSVVRILPRYGSVGQDADGEGPGDQGGQVPDEIVAAVSGGFFSVADDRVSILARHSQIGSEVDQPATRAALEDALADAERLGGGDGGESPEVRYLRALLRASGDDAVTG
jgi:F-type H+-transporting ATPase subunit epsilon